MAFPSFNPAQLLAATQATPIKAEDHAAEVVRYLAANGPLFQGLQGFPGVPQLPPGMPLPIGLYPGLQPELGPGGGPLPAIFFETMGYHPYGVEGRRKNATRETTAPLKDWLASHRKNPYPNKAEKVILAVQTKMSMTQVSTWFANARRRLKKENKMTWSPRNRPGEEEEEELADVDGADPQRPSSSTSDASASERRDGESNNNMDMDNGTERAKRKASPSPSTDSESPKKAKIWSIADLSATPKKELEEEGDSKDEKSTVEEEVGPSKKEPEEAPLAAQVNPFLAMQQWLAMSRGGLPAGLLPPAKAAPAFPPNLAYFNPMLLATLQQQAAAMSAQHQAANQLNGSWSEGLSPSPSSSNHSAAPLLDDVKPAVADSV